MRDRDRERALKWVNAHPLATRGDFTLYMSAQAVESLADLLAEARAQAETDALEIAATECDERAILNDAVEGETPMATDRRTGHHATVSGHRAVEARECAAAIRAVAEYRRQHPTEDA